MIEKLFNSILEKIFRIRLRSFCYFLGLIIMLNSNNVFSQLVSDFTTITSNTGCGSLVVEFEDLSTGNPNTWLWDFGNGITSSLQNPVVVYSTPGFYTVKLTVSDATNQDIYTQVDYVKVYTKPTPSITLDESVFCVPREVSFTDLSFGVNNLVIWQWDFGDGGSSTNQNPIYEYQNSGIFSVSLFVKDDKGCENIIVFNDLIEAKETPQANFSSDILITCDSVKEVKFFNNSSNATDFNWHFGDGNTSNLISPQNNYSTGVYSVSLISSNGVCSDTMIQSNMIEVGANVVSDFVVSNSSTCQFTDIQFSDISNYNPDTWFWDFGDGNTSILQNPIHFYQDSGTYNVSLTVSKNGECTQNIQKINYISVFEDPEIIFSSNDTYSCNLPFNVDFSDNTLNAVSWQWFFGNGDSSTLRNPSVDFTSIDEFDISLTVTDNNGCVSSITENDYIITDRIYPLFSVSDSIVCESEVVSFYDLSVSSYPIISYQWEFGDGNNSILSNPHHQFIGINLFDISLTIENNKGCVEELLIQDYIKTVGPAQADFISDKITSCAGENIFFTDLSVSASSINSWEWEFGDGNNTFVQNPIHQYNNIGTYTVKLVVGEGNCRDTIIKDNLIEIIEPTSYFVSRNNCDNPLELQFENYSIGADEIEWDFGDGNVSTDLNPIHIYSDTGAYNVRLRVTNNSTLCTHEFTERVIVNIPIADFSYLINANNSFEDSVVCLPKKRSHIEVLSSNVRNYRVDWGDGYLGLNRKDHLYSQTGVYDVTLMITDVNGCKDTLTKNDMFRVTNVESDFIISNVGGCDSLIVDFVDLSSVNSDVYWDFGDGNNSIINNPQHTYTNEGFYDVTLYSVSIEGCKDTLTRKEYIKFVYPVVDFEINDSEICIGENVLFTDISEGIGLDYSWDFGNGITSQSINPIINYNSVGLFPVTLTITDTYGCSSVKNSDTIYVQEVFADFTPDIATSNCPPLITTFTNNSTGNIVDYIWNFGDSTISNQINPSHLFLNSGSYDVSLIVIDNFTCVDTVKYSDLISIYGPSGSFTFTTNKICDYDSVEFIADVKNTDTYLWDFGDGIYSNDSNPTHSYTSGDIFHPTLIIENNSSCQFIISSIDSIEVIDLNIDAGLDKNLCLGDSVLLESTGTSTYYNWDSSSFILSPSNANTLVFPTYSTMYYLNSSDGMCFDRDSVFVFVDSNVPQPNFYTLKNCFKDSMEFYGNSGINASSYSWEWTILGENLYSKNDYFQFDTIGVYDVNLLVTNLDNNCDANISQVVEVLPLPEVNFRTNEVCFGEKTNFINLSGDNVTSVLWSFGDGYQSSFNLNPSVLFSSPGIFNSTLVVNSDIGCLNTITKEVVVHENPKVFLEILETCEGSETTFISSIFLNDGFITNWNWDFGDKSISSDLENPTHIYDEWGEFNVELTVQSNYGCVDSEFSSAIIHPNPIVLFDIEQVCIGDETKFTSLSLIEQGELFSYEWNFGDGNNSFYPNSSNVFASSGFYPVILTVTSNQGCASNLQKDVQIFSLPEIDFLVDTEICESEEIQFVDNTLTDDEIVEMKWNFGDRNTSNLKDPFHVYKNSGIYDISLLVVTENGCSDELIRNNFISVFENPVASFDMSDRRVSMLKPEIIFTNKSDSSLYFEWDFDNGIVDFESVQKSITFEESGIYDVLLYVENDNRCYDEVVHQVIVDDIFSVFVPTAFTPDNDGLNDDFIPLTSGVYGFEMKIFNRWGELIFLSNDKNIGWNGSPINSDRSLEPGTYMYNISVTDINEKQWVYNGEVNLIK